MAKIIWTVEALRWLEEIHAFIAEEDADAAMRVAQGIYKRVQDLQSFPNLGYMYSHSDRPVRVLLFGHYRIAYLVKDDLNIDILGVFHGALDIKRYPL